MNEQGMASSQGEDQTNAIRQRVGDAVRRARKAAGLSQNDLASKIGVRSATISDIERAANLPDLATLIAIADALNCTLDIVSGREPPPPEEYDVDRLAAATQESFEGIHDAFADLLTVLQSRGSLSADERDRVLRHLSGDQ